MVKLLSTSSRCSSLRETVLISNLTSLSENEQIHKKKRKHLLRCSFEYAFEVCP